MNDEVKAALLIATSNIVAAKIAVSGGDGVGYHIRSIMEDLVAALETHTKPVTLSSYGDKEV